MIFSVSQSQSCATKKHLSLRERLRRLRGDKLNGRLRNVPKTVDVAVVYSAGLVENEIESLLRRRYELVSTPCLPSGIVIGVMKPRIMCSKYDRRGTNQVRKDLALKLEYMETKIIQKLGTRAIYTDQVGHSELRAGVILLREIGLRRPHRFEVRGDIAYFYRV